MDKLKMRVYLMRNPDGSPRKYWCFATHAGHFITRWGGAGRSLTESRKPSQSAEPHKVVAEKEGKGYVFQGEYNVTHEILFAEAQAATAPQPAATTAFPKADAVLYWTAKQMPEGWKQSVVDALNGIDEAVVSVGTASVSVQVNGIKIVLKEARSSGLVKEADGDWVAGLVLLRLASFLPIEIADDKSNPVDRRSLKGVFMSLGYDFGFETYEDFATKIGLIPKMDKTIKEVSDFFF